MRTADDDPREVKRARKQAEAEGKERKDRTSAEDSGKKKIKSMLKNILEEGKI